MDGITSASPIAFLGSILAHAAFGAAVIGFGPVSAKVDAPKAPEAMVFFETVEPAAEPEPVSEPPMVHRVVRPVAARPVPVATPAPLEEPPLAEQPVLAPAPVPEPVTAAPVVGLTADATTDADAKGFAAGATAVGAKVGTAPTHGGLGATEVRGVVGGSGDRSRAAGLADGRNWECPFPQEAEDEGIEAARVTLEVQIGTNNAVDKATVVSDPGYGFGQEARRCALRRRWFSQLDSHGAPITGRATVVVNFVR